MYTDIIIAGHGGQGVLFAGTLLAQTAVEENKQTTWFPSYGAEMRGGTAYSAVIISDEEIGSPIVTNPSTLIALNEHSFNKFTPKMKDNSIAIINSSLINNYSNFKNIKAFPIPATEIADKQLGDTRMTNLIMIGFYIKNCEILNIENAKKACEKILAAKPKLIPINKKALELGYTYCDSILEVLK